jgi:dTDP-4-dehydrorhamnose 3,5-epimerase-like enzyme
MTILIRELTLNVDKNGRGFEIQGMQKSKLLEGCDVKDIVLQTIRPHKIRGNHYHLKKTEWFLPLRGLAILSWSDVDGPSQEKHSVVMAADFQNPKLYLIQPKTCHAIENKSEEDFYMLAMSSEDYDQEDNPKC